MWHIAKQIIARRKNEDKKLHIYNQELGMYYVHTLSVKSKYLDFLSVFNAQKSDIYS
jgi:hypothetical protein